MKIIQASIDLTKINKEKITKHQNGSQYYPISIFVNDEPDKYKNDTQIMEGQTKEERESKAKKICLGNGKTVYSSTIQQTPKKEEKIDLPF